MLYYKNFALEPTNFSGQGEKSPNSWFYKVENPFCIRNSIWSLCLNSEVAYEPSCLLPSLVISVLKRLFTESQLIWFLELAEIDCQLLSNFDFYIFCAFIFDCMVMKWLQNREQNPGILRIKFRTGLWFSPSGYYLKKIPLKE